MTWYMYFGAFCMFSTAFTALAMLFSWYFNNKLHLKILDNCGITVILSMIINVLILMPFILVSVGTPVTAANHPTIELLFTVASVGNLIPIIVFFCSSALYFRKKYIIGNTK